MDMFEGFLMYEKEVAKSKIEIINQFLKHQKQTSFKSTSKIDIVKNVLKISGRPMHISEIIEIAKRDFDVQLERDSIVSILVKKIKAGQTFIRTSPNTFALKQ